jgi:hypothetical protein
MLIDGDAAVDNSFERGLDGTWAHLAVENSAHVLTLQPAVNLPLVFKRR